MRHNLKADGIARLVGEIGRAKLGDPRRTVRGMKITERLARRPGASLPEALVTAVSALTTGPRVEIPPSDCHLV